MLTSDEIARVAVDLAAFHRVERQAGALLGGAERIPVDVGPNLVRSIARS